MEEIVVQSWDQLNKELYENSWKPDLALHRSPYIFRGLANKHYKLRTSLMRLGGDYASLESHLLRNFRKYAPRQTVPGESVWNWLALAQHHGLPTRLLDWTYSPYVALHFATANPAHFDQDGVVWCLNYIEAKKYLPKRLKESLERSGGGNVFTAEMLSEASATFEGFTQPDDADFVVIFEPPSFDERIVNQFALFSMVSQPTVTLDDWMANKPNLYRRIIIPASLKWEVRDKLDMANITERVLFPGLEGISRWLKRYYGVRKAPGQA